MARSPARNAAAKRSLANAIGAGVLLPNGPKLAANAIVAYEGDSITAGISAGATWAWFLDFALSNRLRKLMPFTNAQGGKTAATMAGQVATVMATNPKIVMFLGGTNDISGNRTAAQIKADIQSCVSGYLAGGAEYVVIGTITKRVAPNGLTTAQEAIRIEVNDFIRSLASAKVKVVDLENVLDPSSSDLADGIHPSWIGASKIAAPFIAATTPLVAAEDLGPFYATGANLLGSKGLMTGTAGAKAGTVPPVGNIATGWSIESSIDAVVTCSKVVGGDGIERQRVVVSGTASAAGFVLVGASASGIVGSVAGDRFEAWGDIDIAAGAQNLRNANARIEFTTYGPGRVTDLVMDGSARSGIQRSPTITTSSAKTSIDMGFVFKFASGAVSADITIGRPSVRKA